MRQFGTIFRFEFKNYLKSKSFLILTVVLVVGVGVVLSIPRIREVFGAQGAQPAEAAVVAVAGEDGAQVRDAVPYFSKAVAGKTFRAVDEDLDALKNDVENGKYESAVLITGPLSYTRVVKNVSMYDESDSVIDEALLAKYRADTLARLGVSPDDAQELLGAQIKSSVVQTAGGKDQMKTFFYTYILIFALYMAILVYGQLVASSVATEKSTRAMELLITSTDPNNLMFGKVFGAGTAGLSQFVLIFGSGYLFYNLNAKYYGGNAIVQSIFDMPLSILLYAVMFFLLGFFLYAFLYGALGSLVSRMEELNSTVMPVSYLFIIAFFVVIYAMTSGNVDSVLMKACSFIPFTSPMAMFVRIAMGNVAVWEVALSVLILIVSTVAVGFIAAAVYRIGVLLYGKAPKPGEVIKMLKNSR